MNNELKTLFEEAKKDIENLTDVYLCSDINTELLALLETFVKKVDAIEPEEKELCSDADVVELVKIHSFDAGETEDILNALDKDYVDDFIQSKADSTAIVIRIDSLQKRERLREFIESEIYPFYKEFENKVEGL